MSEPKKFSFGFSKVVKKPALIPPKPAETEGVEYIKCVEDKTVKLVNEEANKPKPLPVIPMPPGSSVKDRILEAIRARNAAKNGGDTEEIRNKVEGLEGETNESGENADANTQETPNGPAKPLTLEEMAEKELLEGAKMAAAEEKKPEMVITGSTNDATKKEPTLDDYENMPIGDYGLAMLRGMGWDPKKGIGLNEKIVTPAVPQVRPKGMGLGADKALAAQNPQSKASEELVMKKGSMVKVITGPYANLYGKVEGFEELPGRIAVRLALSNSLVSLSEFMVQLVGPTEYGKNAKVMNLDKYNAALNSQSKPADENVKLEEPKYRPSSPPASRRRNSRSRSPSYRRETSRRDRSRERTRKRESRRSNSSDSEDYRKKKEEHHSRTSRKKSKYRSDSSGDDYKSKKNPRDKERSKYSKNDRSDSDNESNSKRHKKSKKSKKYR